MDIVVASDEGYVAHLATLVCSICENNKNHKIDIHILDGGITDSTYDKLLKLKLNYGQLDFFRYEVSDEFIIKKIGCQLSKDRSLTTYARIFIPEILDTHIHKAIYMDVDAIVLDSLEELYGLEMDEFAIAGVRDTNPISRHRNVGLSDSDVYINAGMILWNLKKCREIGAVKQCVDFVRSRNGEIDAMDQGTINGVFGRQGLIQVIHPKFNAFTSLFQLKKQDVLNIYGLSEYYSDDEIMEARKESVFVHFTPNMTTRPWVKHCAHPLRDRYWDYRKMTEFKDFHLDEDKRTLKLRLLGTIFRNCPKSVYIFWVQTRRK